MRTFVLAVSCAVFVAACNRAPLPEVNKLAENTGVITLPEPETGICRANDVTPAVIETVTEKNVLEPGVYDVKGGLIRPPIFETTSRQVIVQERQELQFEALCEADLTPAYVTNLQRALAARGFYNGPANGELNWRTRRGVRMYQQDQGIDSAILSMETARRLGLTAYNFEG